jgi:hypothetical protein
LIGKPNVIRQLSACPKHIDWYSPTAIPIAANAQINGLKNGYQAAADGYRRLLMKATMITKGGEKNFRDFDSVISPVMERHDIATMAAGEAGFPAAISPAKGNCRTPRKQDAVVPACQKRAQRSGTLGSMNLSLGI